MAQADDSVVFKNTKKPLPGSRPTGIPVFRWWIDLLLLALVVCALIKHFV
jgi:hypothetical protein